MRFYHYICRRMKRRILFILALVCAAMQVSGQTVLPEEREVVMNEPTFVPTVKVGKVLLDGDSTQFMELNDIYVYPPVELKNKRERRKYNQLVSNVKKVLPIAKEANTIIIETYEFLQTLPNKKAKDEHMKLVEKNIKKEGNIIIIRK